MQPKVSVIIPFYKGRDLLIEALKSVLAQSYTNTEIILVNDGSPEDLTELLRNYGAEIIYIVKENGGAASARNRGMSVATGDYIAFLDSDDIWLPTKLEKQISFMIDTQTMMSHTGFYYWFPETGKAKIIDNSMDFGFVKDKFYISMKVATPSVIISRSLIKEHPEIIFPEEFRNGEDTQFYRAIANIYPIALIEEPLLKVRMRSNNSYKSAISRFDTNAKAYLIYRNDTRVLTCAKAIMYIYYVYSKILGKKATPFKEKIGRLLWTLPYIIERVYAKRFSRKTEDDFKYLKKWEQQTK